ncbi:MAG: ornithine cyclodeaminase family protein [Eubacteriales bacterium]|nr:ornithine cyclodeaminase family protein [Eubacteriales bacterium]MDY3332618.1 ornithine cyclodeaminase family protein [Gallibacter sp.]
MLVLKKDDIQQVYTMNDAINAAYDSMKLYSKGDASIPLRTAISVPNVEGNTLFMPGYVSGVNATAIKIVSVFPKNVEKNLPVVPASVLTLDSDTGIVNCIMDGTYVTGLRTGAVAGMATKLLANEDASIFALIGTGGQAIYQLEAVLAVRNIKEVRVCARNFEKAKKFVDNANNLFADKYGCVIKAVETSDEAIENADIITTVTTSNVPTFDASKVKKGAHINGMGSYTPDFRELSLEIIKEASEIYFDTLEGVWAEAGDFIIPRDNGDIVEDDIAGEIGQLILGYTVGRKTHNDITIFKSVGSAVLDVVTANEIFKKASKEGVGTLIQM